MLMRKVLKASGLVIGAFLVVAVGLYQFFGLRVVLDGGGTPHLRFVQSSDRQAEQIERHRQTQRAESDAGAISVGRPATNEVQPAEQHAPEPPVDTTTPKTA